MAKNRCAGCGHGYGVHQRLRSPLYIRRGRVEFFASAGEARQVCTGYPDMMGECECRRFRKRER